MDKIRKALDLARLERQQQRSDAPRALETLAAAETPKRGAIAAPLEPRAEAPTRGAIGAPLETLAAANAPKRGPIGAIVYTCTRVVQVSPEHLEARRIVSPGASGAAAAGFRMLRTQVLQRMAEHKWRTLAVFSPSAGEGRTTTAVNLALHIANDRDHTVLLVDMDLRRPAVAATFGFAPEYGIEDVLSGQAEVRDCLYHPDGFDRLVVLPARQPASHSSEVLAGARCRELVAELRARYEERIVIFDLPPVLTTDDALAFAPHAECGLMVAVEGRTRREDLVRSIELLRERPIVGTVLNRAASATN